MRKRRKPLTKAKQNIAVAFMPFALGFTYRFRGRWWRHADELESGALMGLVEAAATYDPGRGLKFTTLAESRIVGSIRDTIRSQLPRGWRSLKSGAPMVFSLPIRKTGLEDVESRGVVLGCSGDDPADKEIADHESFEGMIRPLTDNQKEVCRLIFAEGKTQRQAARIMGYGQTRISTLYNQAIDRLSGTIAS